MEDLARQRAVDIDRMGALARLTLWFKLALVALWRALRIGQALRWALHLLWRGMIRVYSRLIRHRGVIRPMSIRVAEAVWRVANTPKGAASLDLLMNLHKSWPRTIARVYVRLIWTTIVFVLTTFIAAGQSERALVFARLLNLLFRHEIRARRRPTCNLYFEALFRTQRFNITAREMSRREIIDDHHLNHVIGVAHLFSRNIDLAKFYLQRAIEIHDGSYIDHRMLGRVFLMENDDASASKAFERSIRLQPVTVMAHQNYAGRYDIGSYKPVDWELEDPGPLLIYDNLGQLAEDFFLRGQFKLSFELYQRMLDHQRKLAKKTKRLPPALIREIQKVSDRFDPKKPVRILPYEWVTQFGHIGLLDSYLKMAEFGWYPKANYLLLAPASKVVNNEYLRCWHKRFIIIRGDRLVDQLFPYQRQFGDGFMAYDGAGGKAEPWTLRAAKAQARWSAEKRAPLIALSEDERRVGEAKLRELGVPEGAWFVGLHVREGGFYGEAAGGMSTHRNASIDDYVAAVNEVVARGGYVIRLGDRSMQPYPEPSKFVIDYPHTSAKSVEMDIFLCASARFVIGTTSGLTTACISFGTPMLIVNAISNDWQLWTASVDFIFKRVYDRRNDRILNVREAFSQPVQGFLINNAVMAKNGYFALNNTADEIHEAVLWKLETLIDGQTFPETAPILSAYARAMSHNPLMFGAARPVPAFLKRHPDLIALQAAPQAQAAPLEALAV